MLIKRQSNIPNLLPGERIMQDMGLTNLSDLDHKILQNMERYGGSFVKTLALLTRQATYNNLTKLVDAFQEYYEAYLPEKWEGKKHGRK